MEIIIDIVIVALIALSVFLGYKKGLVTLAIGLCSFIIALVLTLILYKPITNLVINTTTIDETIENSILEKANDVMQEGENELTNQVIEEAKNNMLPETARTIATNIITFAVVLILFLVIKIALRFVTALANLITKLPVLNQFNKMGGIIYGLLRGLLIIYAVLLIVNLSGQISPQNIVYQNVQQSYIGKFMCNSNIFSVFFN